MREQKPRVGSNCKECRRWVPSFVATSDSNCCARHARFYNARREDLFQNLAVAFRRGMSTENAAAKEIVMPTGRPRKPTLKVPLAEVARIR